jgi:hypothetical protein
MMKFSRAISRVKWLCGVKINKDRDGLRNVGFLTAQPFDPAVCPRELHHTFLQNITDSPLFCIINKVKADFWIFKLSYSHN